ncbi:helix-turn-helix domain-containing protein [Goekera deserti]|uniref:Helix-turn-helix transcriptional regulator n=1 Tax=Goekera deserti TaxID=2497753 RepID=A0A7K3WEL2_9ACTN|nr:helix-turn-helix transcriptional regulator [Goekera deserti]NDI48680.1 helix-turn-helix domain-containing protein [Goekera deserti]NEL54941.1 helix-turn-helix transcriptional regulator [Goekera deserti]
MDEEFDGAGSLRRIRRTGDLSQRQLANRLGISPAALGGMEAGRSRVPATLLARAAALVGLRLVLVDGDGHHVPPMAAGGARDRAGRRLPAHLDTRSGDVDWWHGEERYSRQRPEWTYDVQRDLRDRWRLLQGLPDDHHVPGPGDSLAARAAARAAAQDVVHRWARVDRFLALTTGEEQPWSLDCACPPGCDDLLLADLPDHDPERGRRRPLHVRECPCGCDVG